MNKIKRKFDYLAYNQFDKSAKIELKKYLERHGFKLVDDSEKKAKVDAVYFSPQGKEMRFENEVRISSTFERIISQFPTVHIPSRKYVSNFDTYFVWKEGFQEFLAIDKKVFLKHRDKQVDVTCKASTINPEITEKFIDIPKGECRYFKKNDKGKFRSYSLK